MAQLSQANLGYSEQTLIPCLSCMKSVSHRCLRASVLALAGEILIDEQPRPQNEQHRAHRRNQNRAADTAGTTAEQQTPNEKARHAQHYITDRAIALTSDHISSQVPGSAAHKNHPQAV